METSITPLEKKSACPKEGYHPGLEMLKCYNKYFENLEDKKNEHIDAIQLKNFNIKIMSDLNNTLANAKQSKKPLNMNETERVKKLAYLTYLMNPTIFEHKIHNLPANPSTLSEIREKLRNDGFADHDIDLRRILREINVDDIRFDSLSENEIDSTLPMLDGEIKIHTADLQESMMHLNRHSDDGAQMTDHSREVLKDAKTLIDAIIGKTGNHS